jgi:hypothetical protein
MYHNFKIIECSEKLLMFECVINPKFPFVTQTEIEVFLSKKGLYLTENENKLYIVSIDAIYTFNEGGMDKEKNKIVWFCPKYI